ncbi:helix-turn-helix domain-containing protein [Duganella aceris]|jgi:excisionase family DNA binding protein|uniref:Helix-turn-helix domain-containing protein n=1 Tax=Duganella aceris TaxID=2703883 RepID=A0ABX0FP44_9BURK|nr:helix-turn-helix domain-containing protein [Duganella aceris]NGZ86258.1 helix-turn-helix domain-containing protein [Duganella aceris]
MLTTEAAAGLMQCSRSYLSMMIDNKKLANASRSAAGQWLVPESSVRAWIEERDAKATNADYHAAAEESGMYDIPETAFIKANKRRHA